MKPVVAHCIKMNQETKSGICLLIFCLDDLLNMFTWNGKSPSFQRNSALAFWATKKTTVIISFAVEAYELGKTNHEWEKYDDQLAMVVYWKVIQQTYTRFCLFALLSFDISIPNLPPPKKNWRRVPRSRGPLLLKNAGSFWMINDDNKPLLWKMVVCKPTRVKERMGDFGGSTDHPLASLDILKKKIPPMTSRESSPLIFWGSWQYPILKHEKTISNWRCFLSLWLMTFKFEII